MKMQIKSTIIRSSSNVEIIAGFHHASVEGMKKTIETGRLERPRSYQTEVFVCVEEERKKNRPCDMNKT